MNAEQQRELYLMLRDEPGDNRGREFYDGQCQSCFADDYETHAPNCRMAAMLVLLGGEEEVKRQRIRREQARAKARERADTLERHRRGVTTSNIDAMNLAFKKFYGGFGE